VQAPEGYWRIDWNAPAEARSSETSRVSVDMTSEILVTGHHLEWLMLIPVEIQPPMQETLRRAARWLLAELLQHSEDAEWVAQWYCPASHAARAIHLLSKPTAKASPNADRTGSGSTSAIRVARLTQNAANSRTAVSTVEF